MCDRKSEVSDKIQSVTHGKPTKDRTLEPDMFQMLSWADPQACCSDHHQSNEVQKCPISCSMVVQRVKSPQKKNEQQQLACESCPCHKNNNNEIPTNYQQQLIKQKIQSNCCNNEYYTKVEQINKHQKKSEFCCKKKTLKPHQVKDQLYMYEEAHLKKSKSQVFPKSPRGTERLKSKPTPRKLNENDQKDRQIIERRKNKIKQFNRLTRDLPNSAFTTYYGKPAFEAYGRCNSQHGLKTHNIMPQKGQNNPKSQQCYTSALIHGKKLKNQTYIPRKPIESFDLPKKYPTEQSQYIHLPMERPDLINHVRFSDPDSVIKKKASVPSVTNAQKKELNKKYTFSKQKKAKRVKGKSVQNDGLKYMNNREDLLAILQARKTKNSKLAYKVTQCYPEGWPHQQKSGQQQQTESVAAGKKYIKGDSAKNVIYRIN